LTRDEIAERAPGIFAGDGHYEWYFRAPGGEICDAFAARIAAWLAEAGELPGLAVVTHAS